jgi:site-specific DNA recombinase
MRALVVNPAEAEIVRGIFRTYVELGSVHALGTRLEAEGIRSKVCRTPAGRVRGGGPLSRGALFYLLKNRVYVGDIPHRDTSYPGAHQAIVDPEVFDAAQQMLADHRQQRSQRPTRAASMVLRGRLFDVDGAPMSPSFTYRGPRIYRYYVSAPLQQGGKMAPRTDAVRRVPAPEIEGLVQRELQRRFGADDVVESEELFRPVKRVDVDAHSIRITLVRKGIAATALSGAEIDAEDPKLAVVTVPIRCRLRGGRTWLTAPQGMPATQRVHRDAVLIRALRAAHRTVAGIGFRCGDGGFEAGQKLRLANTHERRLCRLAFLAPDIQQRIMDGHQPLNMTLERLIKEGVPTSWAEQRRRFGLQK